MNRRRTSPLFLVLCALVAAGFLVVPYLVFVVAPQDPEMGFSQKIFYFHVPCAWAMFLAAMLSAVGGGALLFAERRWGSQLVAASAELTVVFRDDGGCERFRIDYDSSDFASGSSDGALRSTREVLVGRTGTWRTVRLQLPQVFFCNRTRGADFRIAAVSGRQSRLTVREVIVRKLPGVLARGSD